MRDITKIIDKLIPILEENKIEISELNSIKDSANFSSPETIGLCWGRLGEWLNDQVDEGILPIPDENSPLWVRKLSDIMEDKPIPKE